MIVKLIKKRINLFIGRAYVSVTAEEISITADEHCPPTRPVLAALLPTARPFAALPLAKNEHVLMLVVGLAPLTTSGLALYLG